MVLFVLCDSSYLIGYRGKLGHHECAVPTGKKDQ